MLDEEKLESRLVTSFLWVLPLTVSEFTCAQVRSRDLRTYHHQMNKIDTLGEVISSKNGIRWLEILEIVKVPKRVVLAQ